MRCSFLRSFAGRRVFVTGHTGFKGSWLCLWLHRAGAIVTGYALEPPTRPNNFTVCNVRELLDRHHVADVRDAPRLHQALKEADPDVVLHLAAQSVVRRSYEIPRETFDVNVMGTATLLDGVRALHKPCSVVVVTSDKCYRNVEQVWGYRESDPFGDHDPYGGSKGAAEIVVRSYRHSFFPPEKIEDHGVRLASGRAGNVIGGGDWTKDALLVDVFKAVASNQPVHLRNPRALRPWQHVLQCLSGYLTLASRLLESDDPKYCSGWNFGPLPGNELCVREVVEQFLSQWGSGSWMDESDSKQPHEATILRLCIDKAVWQLGWNPGWTVNEAIRETARWYQHYTKAPTESVYDFSQRQIAAYEAAVASAEPETFTSVGSDLDCNLAEVGVLLRPRLESRSQLQPAQQIM